MAEEFKPSKSRKMSFRVAALSLIVAWAASPLTAQQVARRPFSNARLVMGWICGLEVDTLLPDATKHEVAPSGCDSVADYEPSPALHQTSRRSTKQGLWIGAAIGAVVGIKLGFELNDACEGNCDLAVPLVWAAGVVGVGLLGAAVGSTFPASGSGGLPGMRPGVKFGVNAGRFGLKNGRWVDVPGSDGFSLQLHPNRSSVGFEAFVRYVAVGGFAIDGGVHVSSSWNLTLLTPQGFVGGDSTSIVRIFGQPKYFINVANTAFTPYLGADLSYVKWRTDFGGVLIASAGGIGIGGVAGVVLQIFDRAGLEVGASLTAVRFGDRTVDGATEPNTGETRTLFGIRMGVVVSLAPCCRAQPDHPPRR